MLRIQEKAHQTLSVIQPNSQTEGHAGNRIHTGQSMDARSRTQTAQ